MTDNDNNDDNTSHDYSEALERAMNEMDVLRAIYGGEDDDDDDDENDDNQTDPESSFFEIVSPGADELDQMRKALCDDEEFQKENNGGRPTEIFPDLQIQLQIPINNSDSDNDDRTATLRCRLPLGYPEHSPAVVTSVRLLPALSRSLTDEISLALNEKAAALLGTEAIMDLVEETREILLSDRFSNSSQSNVDPEDAALQIPLCGRRLWIWVHHITSTDRRKSIVREAHERNLTGILKHGYPGVVLVEGPGDACESFVGWIKGNKSRPGGFGRNWGHHVRGEIEFSWKEEEPNTAAGRTIAMTSFQEMEELSAMAKSCREMGLEDEFKEFVMQHKK